MVLAHELVRGDDPPGRWMLFLHGILGRRMNWRGFARKWLDAQGRAGHEDWGAVLVDLRDHGESQGLPGPRTVAAAGADLVELRESIMVAHGGRVAAISGHSFGAKVALSGAAQLRVRGHGVDAVWLVDAPLGPREPGEQLTDYVFAVLGQLPDRFEARGDFIAAVVGAGVSEPTARWLAMNLVASDDDRYRFGLDLDRVRALLADFDDVDLWPTLDGELDAGARVSLIVGARSEAVSVHELDRARARAGLRVATVADAGHWIHVDNPRALLATLTAPAG